VKLKLVHETRYTYDSTVRFSTQYLRLTPRDTARQRVLEWKLETSGQAVRTHDGYGNVLHVLTIDKPFAEIRIKAAGTIETAPTVDEPSDFTGVSLSPLLFLRVTDLTRADDKLAAFAEGYRRRAGTLSGLRELATAVRKSTPEAAPEALAQSFIACCRLLGVPARYVSGYLYSPGSAQVAGHAWAEAHLEDRWRSFDVAHNHTVGEAHIKIAIGADYYDACPIRGVRVGGGTETMQAQSKVEAQ